MLSKALPIVFAVSAFCNCFTFAQIVLESKDIRKDKRPNIANHRQQYDEEKPIRRQDNHYIEPDAVTNSHRPQYSEIPVEDVTEIMTTTMTTFKEDPVKFNVDIDERDEDYRPSNHMRNKHNQIKSFLVRLLDKNEQRMKFASVLPILKVLTPPQQLVLASLISKQLSADARNPALSVEQVEAMFGNNPNVTSDLMLPILLDIANMVRDAKDHMRLQIVKSPHAQLLRRSFSLDDEVDPMESHSLGASGEVTSHRRNYAKSLDDDDARDPKRKDVQGGKIAARIPSVMMTSDDRLGDEVDVEDETSDDDNSTQPISIVYSENNGTVSLFANDTTFDDLNRTLSEDLPVAEKLRALNRFIDRNGNLVVLARPPWLQGGAGGGPKYTAQRKANVEQLIAAHRRRMALLQTRKTLMEMTKQKCDLFTNSLCLESLDYPSEAITGSIRRNQAAMGALLADFPEVSADSAIDGVSAKQESRYTAEHYTNNANRREDGLDAGGGAASGFMCPSTVKYARPQKARATSGEWKYIVNTGEHTQTLRLEKCLRPKEACTYLTDNFKSKCVQVYNYHRLLTWDQHNGLHMDIFKVPTCCSCHIEGYSVAFPPHTGKPHQSLAEHFPGEDIHDVIPYEEIQPSIKRPSTYPGSIMSDIHTGDAQHNFIPGSTFGKQSFHDDAPPSLHTIKHIPLSNQYDDQFQHPSTSIRNVKRPIVGDSLPSYLEPPSKPSVPSFKAPPEVQAKYKPSGGSSGNNYKRGTGSGSPKRPLRRRPIRKKTNIIEDQMVGATSIHETPTIVNTDSFEDIEDSIEDFRRTSPRSTSTTSRPPSARITIKNVAPSTTTTVATPPAFDSPNRRVNYNYHPIIDFFEESSSANKKEGGISDRMDTGGGGHREETEWMPMSPPAPFPLKAPRPEVMRH